MKPMRTFWMSALFVLILVGVGAWLYPHLPARMPVHWSAAGDANGWAPRFWAVALWPVLVAVLAALTVVLPAISPRRFRIQPFAGTWRVVMLAIQAFGLVLGVGVMLAGAGYPVPVPTIATLAVGALLLVLGNYMGKLRKNFFIGIRTPWTLASDVVWERTHRLAGWVFVGAGVAWVVAGMAVPTQRVVWWLVAIVAGMVLVPAIYSYIAYRRFEERKVKPEAGP